VTASERRLMRQTTILTTRQRQVLRLQAYGLTYQEISEELGLSIWTVKNHHKQAVQSLRVALTADRVRTSLACYILGLLDGGLTPEEVARRLAVVTPGNGTTKSASSPSRRDSSLAAD
jgi:DNA-binding CsgD family transcriptional regulator